MKAKNELWNVPTEKTLANRIAGFKSHQTRLMNLAKSRKQKLTIHDEYEQKIWDAINGHQQEQIDAKRHNAAVKANATRKQSKVRSTSVCMKAGRM